MIIECPKCKSTFKVIDSIQIKSFSNFKCSVCNHVWKIKIKNEDLHIIARFLKYIFYFIINIK